MAEPTGLEPATSDVTGRRSNQLNYNPAPVEPRIIRWAAAAVTRLPGYARRAAEPRTPVVVGGTGFEPVTAGV